MKKKYLVVTSFSSKGYQDYAKKFIKSFIKYWDPTDVDLLCYHHAVFPKTSEWSIPKSAPKADNVFYANLDEIPELSLFKEGSSKLLTKVLPPQVVTKGIPWQYDVIKFTNKVFALAAANATVGSDYEWIIWLDADAYTKKPVTTPVVDSWVDPDFGIVHLGRKTATYSETSFVAYNMGVPQARSFLDNMIDTFLNGEFQYFVEWHDGFIFERLLKLHQLNGLKTKSLTDHVVNLSAFLNSPLADYIDHLKGDLKDKTKDEVEAFYSKKKQPAVMPFSVKPVDCVKTGELLENIRENARIIPNWLVQIKTHDRIAVLVSAGPSLEKNIDKIKKLQERGADVFCVKHSYPTLLKHGIIPSFCVLLDPREIDGVSTHGVIRKELFKDTPGDTKFLISSMTHPSVTKYLMGRKAKVIGCHVANAELAQFFEESKGKLNLKTIDATTVGTCAAIRALGFLEIMGYRKVHIVGFDSSMDPSKVSLDTLDDKGRPKYIQVGIREGSPQPLVGDLSSEKEVIKTFITTGELVALYQDFLGVIPACQKLLGISLILDEESLVGYGWAQYLKVVEARKAEEALIIGTRGEPVSLEHFLSSENPCYNS